MEVKTATLADVDNFVMRQDDKAEISELYGLEPYDALRRSIIESEDCWTAASEEKVLCIAGCSRSSDGGCLWVLFADIQLLPLSFFKESRKHAQYMLKKYGNLSNYTAASNVFVIKWAKSLGFTVDEPISYGPNGRLFCRFHKEG
ncbi:MAG: hypothetical protein H6Q72_963 [Firmicutes bacterium]|nr:hypothetical protein [Bacillota bacterium]